MNQNFTQFAFTDSVKQAQEHYGSRRPNARMEDTPDRFVLTEREEALIRTRDMFYMSTVGENGWPYLQFRGGPKGFLKILGPSTLAMADYRGNRQYISVGNINATRKAVLFVIHYPTRERLKIWVEAEVFDAADRPDLAAAVSDPEYGAKVERLIQFEVQAYDWNCPQHITPRYTLDELRAAGIEIPDTIGKELARNPNRFNPF